jgi:hypothetical protein
MIVLVLTTTLPLFALMAGLALDADQAINSCSRSPREQRTRSSNVCERLIVLEDVRSLSTIKPTSIYETNHPSRLA